MKKTMACLALVCVLLAGLLTGCTSGRGPAAAPAAAQAVTLRVAGGWEDCRAIETVGRKFTEKYPECTIVYEYLQDYYTALEKRMQGEEAVDVFFTVNIQADSPMLPYALELNGCEGLDLSQTFDGLRENFALRSSDTGAEQLYAMPLGAEMRGMYINKTLLAHLGIDMPTDQASLLKACETLKQNGYIPFHGNPSTFAQQLLYPWVCNLIANAEDPKAAYERVNTRQPGISEMLEPPFTFLYSLVEQGYYDYKRAQTELNLFTDSTDIDYVRYFLNIRHNGDAWEKADDLGQVAFMPAAMSMCSLMDKNKEDYHSAIEYVFVPSPVGEDGGFAYMSPAHGIAVNKASAQLDWSVRFLNFLFQPENNELFAKEFNIVPNTKSAFDYITASYDIPADHISHLGQVTFDYDFYPAVTQTLVEVSKANNPKYMQQNEDGSVSLYPLSYYMEHLEKSLTSDE